MATGYLLLALGLLALGGLALAHALHKLDERLLAFDERVHREEDALIHVEVVLDDAAESARRAHLRIDNDQRRIEALADQLGWVDDRAHTKTLTGPLPGNAYRSGPPALPERTDTRVDPLDPPSDEIRPKR